MGASIQAILSMLNEEDLSGEKLIAEETRQRFSSTEGGLVQVTDITSHTLGVVLWNEKQLQEYVFPMIRKMTAIPAVVKHSFGTADANMQRAVVKIVEGESTLPEECTPLGVCDVQLPPFLPKTRCLKCKCKPLAINPEFASTGIPAWHPKKFSRPPAVYKNSMSVDRGEGGHQLPASFARRSAKVGRLEQLQVAEFLRAALSRSARQSKQRTGRGAFPGAVTLVAEETAAQKPAEQSIGSNALVRSGRIITLYNRGARGTARSRTSPRRG